MLAMAALCVWQLAAVNHDTEDLATKEITAMIPIQHSRRKPTPGAGSPGLRLRARNDL
jgi:hypothetical protein